MIGILRVRFSSNPDPSSVWPDIIFQNWMNQTIPSSLANYWTKSGWGLFDVNYILFPPIVMPDPRPSTPPPQGTSWRDVLVDQTLNQFAAQLGTFWNLIDRVLIWFAQPTDLFGAADAPYYVSVGGYPPRVMPVWVAVCDIASQFDDVCQELGHAFSLNHDFNASGSEYGSPYSIMSAEIYDGLDSSTTRPPDPRLPDGVPLTPGGTPPQRIGGPLLSAAQLYQFTYFSTFQTSIIVPANFAQSPQTLRLYALDQARGEFPGQRLPCLAVIQRPNGNFYIEVRRSNGYDAKIASAIVIHSYNPATNRIVYEGALPFADGVGDLYWSSSRGGFTLKLENLEQNYQSATFSIHGLGFWRGRRVDLETTSQVQQDVTREQRIVYVNQDCIKGEFDAVEVHRKLVYTLDTTVYGFDSPSYAWFVDGIPIPNAPNSLVKFDTEVTVPFPPHGNASGGAISKTELVEVWCTVNSNRLTISAGPLPVTGLISATKPGVISGPGNFQCNVEVQVRENAAPKVLPVISQDMALSFPCELLEMGVDYWLAYDQCHPQIGPLKETGIPTFHVNPGDPEPYFVGREDLVEVLRLESLARSLLEKSDPRSESVVKYMVGRYNLPMARVMERIKSTR